MAYPPPSGPYASFPSGPPNSHNSGLLSNNNNRGGEMHQGMVNNNFHNYGSNPHFPPQQNNFSAPPPPVDVSGLTRPVNSTNSHQQGPSVNPTYFLPPPSMDHRPLPPMNVNRPPPPINMHRPPPPLQNPHFNFPHFRQGFPPNNSHVGPHLQKPGFLSSQLPPMIPNDINAMSQTHSFPNKQQSLQVFEQSSNEFVHQGAYTNQALERFETEIEKKRKIGQQRLNSWLQKVGKAKKKISGNEPKKKSTNDLKMNDFFSKLQTSLDLITKMSSQVEKLESVISDTDRSSWQNECDIMETFKAKHKDLLDSFQTSKVEQVKKKLTGIRLKRTRLKKAHHQKYLQNLEMKEAKAVKDKEISEWQQKLRSEMKEEVLKKKRKQEMDETLSTITKKIHDANRLIETMTSLEKLRLIRQDAAKKRGDADVGESRQSFEQKIADMTRLVQSQLEVYEEEEQRLRKTIKSEHDESSKKERQLQEKKDEEEQKQKDEDLREKLFGITKDASLSDPLFPYQQYYKQAQTSLPAFVQIRHDWDQHSVPEEHPHGSTIPPGWLAPSDPTSSTWATALT